MKFTTSKKSTSVEFTIEFTSSDFETARLKALERLARKTKIPGFRNGKAPASRVEHYVDPNELSETTLDIMVRTAIPKVYDKENLQPISAPQVEIRKFIPGDSAEVVVSSDIMPEVKLPKYDKLKSKFVEPKVADKDVEDVLGRIAESFAETKTVKREAKLGDDVIIDFTGKKDGEAFQGGSAKDFTLRLGSGQFIPGFEDGVVGHSAGDKFDLKLKFPKDYHVDNLAGADVVFEVLLKQVNEVTIPEMDDKLAAKTGAFKTLKELREDIKKNLVAQAERRAEDDYKDSLLEELIDGVKTDAPKALVEEQAQHIKDDLLRNLQARGAKLEDYLRQVNQTEEQWDKEVHDAAERRVLGHLAVAQLSEELKIKVTDKEVEQQVAEMQAVYQKDENALKELQTPMAQASIRNRIRVNKTMDKLVELNRK